MKKILLVLACSLLLVGCANDSSKEGDGNQKENTPGENGGNQGQTPSGEGGGDGQQGGNENEDVLKKTITFLDGTFIGQLDQPSTRSNFVTYVNGTDDLLSSVSLVGKSESKEIDFQKLDDTGAKVTEKHVVWWMGSAKTTGELTMNFNCDVTGIKLTIQAYHKPFVNTWDEAEPFVNFNADKSAKLYIDTTDNVKDLSFTSDVTPDIVDFTKSYQTPTKQITIGNLEMEQRVFIHSMEISYLK